MTHLRSFAALAGLALLGACAVPIELPPDFLRLHDSEQFRAVTGDDARVWLREFVDPNHASRKFWVDAVEYDFTQQRGYSLVGKGEVKDRSGAFGDWFECAANVRGERIGYLVAIWVAGENIRVVEFAARADVFAARVESMRAALATVR